MILVNPASQNFLLLFRSDVICHICGRKYTIHSINLHIPNCERMYHERQQQLPKKEQKPIPTLPKKAGKMKLEQRNELALKIYQDHQKEECRICHEKFMPNRLKAHEPQCAKAHGKPWPPPAKYSGATKPNQAKNTVICHICGRKYTSHSIDIHLPQCEKLWNDRQAKLPKSEQKPCPQMPKRYKKEKQNEIAMQVFEKNTLEACQFCGRTFLPDRLKVHLRSCERNHTK